MKPQLIAKTVTDPLPAARTVLNFGNIPFNDADRPPAAGFRPAEGLLCTLRVSAAPDAEPGVRPVVINYQGFSAVNGVKILENGVATASKIPATWIDGKIIVFSLHGLFTQQELEMLAAWKRMAK
jgi:hypothetical protein